VRFNMTVSGEFQDPSCGGCFVMRSAGGASVSVSAGAPQAHGGWGQLACDGTLQSSSYVSWSAVAGASAYNIRFRKTAANAWTLVGTTGAVVSNGSLTISDPTRSGDYYVTAVVGGVEGPPSNVVQAAFFSQCP
jgi:hypothetical protein